jgi:pimeloyl-ACP methyl ester carboxylesterase
VVAGEGARTLVLLHGFPQTWWKWRPVIPPLVDGGFRVIAPDYRGVKEDPFILEGLVASTKIREWDDAMLAKHARVESETVPCS